MAMAISHIPPCGSTCVLMFDFLFRCCIPAGLPSPHLSGLTSKGRPCRSHCHEGAWQKITILNVGKSW